MFAVMIALTAELLSYLLSIDRVKLKKKKKVADWTELCLPSECYTGSLGHFAENGQFSNYKES